MGAGFPQRPNRDAYGPSDLEDALPIENPKQDIGAAQFKLAFWQLAGLGRAAPRAVLAFTVDGAPAVDAVTLQALAWDPNADLPALAIVRTGVGVYEIPFAVSYPDETGTARPTAIVGGLAAVMGTGSLTAKVNVTAPNVVEVRVFDDAGAAADPAAGEATFAALW